VLALVCCETASGGWWFCTFAQVLQTRFSWQNFGGFAQGDSCEKNDLQPRLSMMRTGKANAIFGRGMGVGTRLKFEIFTDTLRNRLFYKE